MSSSWKERTKEVIELISPNGSEFEALWKGNNRSKAKKLGVFEYPKIRGSFVQDLDVRADIYPLNIFFNGSSHDAEAKRFYLACSENGKWEIIHPVHGQLFLNLMSVTEVNAVVDNANTTEMQTEWIESIDPAFIITDAQLAADIQAQADIVNSQAAQQFNANINQDKLSFIQAIKDTVATIQTAVDSALGPLFETVAEINKTVNAIQRGINDTLTAVILRPLQLAGQIQQLIQIPGLVTSNIQSRLDAYQKLADDIFNLSPDSSTTESKNQVSTQELTLSAVLVAISQVTATGVLATRTDALETIEFNTQLFNESITNLDTSQELFINVDIDSQYFSQSQAFPDISKIISTSLKLLLSSLFNLSAEKRFILDRPRSPIEITITEYGDLGENDINFDLFITSNKLKKNEILLLPAGKEVVVYV